MVQVATALFTRELTLHSFFNVGNPSRVVRPQPFRESVSKLTKRSRVCWIPDAPHLVLSRMSSRTYSACRFLTCDGTESQGTEWIRVRTLSIASFGKLRSSTLNHSQKKKDLRIEKDS